MANGKLRLFSTLIPLLDHLPQLRPVLVANHIANALFEATVTRVVEGILQIVVVIVQHLLILLDFPHSDNPHAVVDDVRLRVSIAAVVYIARRIPPHTTVDVDVLVDREFQRILLRW